MSGSANKRGAFSWKAVRTLALATVLTLLAWALAEARTLQFEKVETRVRLGATNGDRAVRIAEGELWNGSVELELRGPTASIASARERLVDNGVTLSLGDQFQFVLGEREIDLREAVSRSAVFEDGTVSVERVIPERVRLQMDDLETVTLPLRVNAGVELASSPSTDPVAVSVTLPAGLVAFLPDRAEARVSAEALEGVRPGRPTELAGVPVSVALEPGAAPWAMTIRPPRAAVTLTLRSATETLLVPAVPVRLLLPPELAGRWKVTLEEDDRFLRDVRLSGPAAQIDRLREQGFTPTAVVRMTPDLLEAGSGDAVVSLIDLPPGIARPFESFRIRYRAERVIEESQTRPPAVDAGAPATSPGDDSLDSQPDNEGDDGSG